MVVYEDHNLSLVTNVTLHSSGFFFPTLTFTIRTVTKKNYFWCGILYSGIISGALCG